MAASVALVTFVFTTLINEPASMVALLVILVFSVALDVGWKWGHGDRSARTDQFGHSATA